MDHRTALKNYHTAMVKRYGENYSEHWTEDDKETFEILARRARKAVQRRILATGGKDYVRRLRGSLTGHVAPDQREREWAEWTKKYGDGIVGTLAPAKNIYAGAHVESTPVHSKGKKYPLSDGNRHMAQDPAVLFDHKSDEYITGVTAADLLRSFNH